MSPICQVVAKDKDSIWSSTWSVKNWGPVDYCVVDVLFGGTFQELLECPTKDAQLFYLSEKAFPNSVRTHFQQGLIDYPLPPTGTHTHTLTHTHALLSCVFSNLKFWLPIFY